MADLASKLRSTTTIRERCGNILAAADAGQSRHFTVQRSRLEAAAQLVEQVTRRQYPDLRIPYHSRWRHFESGGVDRKGELDALLAGRDAAAQARARIDLTLVSVLLDAGAGPQWRYAEVASGQSFNRSEGLGVASFRAFLQGLFSSDASDPLRVDAAALQRVDEAALAAVFQVSADNPLVGLAGRATLLRGLGDTLAAQPAAFGLEGRPGRLLDLLTDNGQTTHLPAPRVLQALLDHLSPIWLTGSELEGVPLGDCWQHPAAGGSGPTAGWVPFHKLSQWLTYSLLEPFEWAGITLTELDGMTGLPEYRNGGLLLDTQVLLPRDPNFAERQYTAANEAIVEWRALTVALIDELAPLVRARLGKTAAEMPLACILEGGTWAAGREIARTLREGGKPPLNIASDGTVF
ncbi:URC4/urg3 family protein [Ideonella azotifigens]|uniref:URC4/urg3 family protein n=2 Tax=Ideonella azotifigens TaxID=513160 RepID=A0ABN1JJ42_9BURK|nr:URC4/urg3 family protein [Ideonella azotifigens]MCD2342002.1 URC4/urg3 family protein [Ideonella azotifigens]